MDSVGVTSIRCGHNYTHQGYLIRSYKYVKKVEVTKLHFIIYFVIGF